MQSRRWQKTVIFRRKIFLFNQRRNSSLLEDLTLENMIELIDLIPDDLIGMSSLNLAQTVTLSSNFTNIEEYLKWLSDLFDIIYHGKYFNKKILSPLDNKFEVTLSDFLIDSFSMVNNPVTVLHETRRKIMNVRTALIEQTDTDLTSYYQTRLDNKFNSIIATPIIAIAELAGSAT